MTQIDIYTKPWCPYCKSAKALLRSKGVDFNEIDVSMDAQLEDEMQSRSGRHTVPQIFINDFHVGGSDDLHEAERNGELNALLTGNAVATEYS